jgi:hypothetical protein
VPIRPSAARSERGFATSGRGSRLGARPPSSVSGARIPKGSGPFAFYRSKTGLRGGAVPRSMDRTTGVRWVFFNNSEQGDLGTGRGCVLQFAGVAQLAERDLAMVEATSSILVIRSTSGVSMHSAAARHGVGGAGCARPQARSRAARHLLRKQARARAHPKWWFAAPVAQQAEQPPCKRQAARSIRRRGPPIRRVRLAGPGRRTFNPVTRVRIPHATPFASLTQRPECRPVEPEAAGSTPARGAKLTPR